MKKTIVVTGGAGFVGSNLIKFLLEKTNYSILSIDDYSSGNKKNHIKSYLVYIFYGSYTYYTKYLNFL